MGDIEIKFEVLDPRHGASLALFYRSIFKKVVPPDYFTIKYSLNDPSQRNHSLVGIIDGKVIGFYGALSQEFQLEGEVHELVYACDFFLEEIYRGTGVFKKFYQELLRRLKKSDATYLYAFQSEQTYKFCKKNGWLDAPAMERYQISVFPKPIKSVQERLMGAAWSIQTLEKRLVPYQKEEALESYIKWTEGGMIYTKEFFLAKATVPRYFVEIAGCHLWMKYDYRITIGFLQIGPEGNVRELIKILRKIARRSGIHEIVFHTTTDGDNLDLLRKELPALPSYKASYFALKEDAPSFDRFKIHFINGDLF